MTIRIRGTVHQYSHTLLTLFRALPVCLVDHT